MPLSEILCPRKHPPSLHTRCGMRSAATSCTISAEGRTPPAPPRRVLSTTAPIARPPRSRQAAKPRICFRMLKRRERHTHPDKDRSRPGKGRASAGQAGAHTLQIRQQCAAPGRSGRRECRNDRRILPESTPSPGGASEPQAALWPGCSGRSPRPTRSTRSRAAGRTEACKDWISSSRIRNLLSARTQIPEEAQGPSSDPAASIQVPLESPGRGLPGAGAAAAASCSTADPRGWISCAPELGF